MTPQSRDIFADLSAIAENRHRVARRAQSEQLVVCVRAIWQRLARRVGWVVATLRQAGKARISW